MMESPWLESRPRENTSMNMNMDTGIENEYVPAWKMPISKSFTSYLSNPGDKYSSEGSSGIGSGGERDNSTSSNSDPESCSLESSKKKPQDLEEEGQLIQILLPCIICNRTFAPEALERHSKVCTRVNVKTPYKPERGQFKSEEQRKKGTKVEYFIPPPSSDPPDSRLSSSFSRGSKNRSSLRGTSCTTRSTIALEPLSLQSSNFGISPNTRSSFRRQRSISQTRGDDHSEFGSNSEESQTIPDNEINAIPSYAKPITTTDECPYCNRQFGPKAFDRHVEFCKEKYVRQQYEIQPVPREKVEAFERQEIRTKYCPATRYRPLRGSSSCTSLRSASPGKDFASMAYKLFGLRRSDGNSNLYNNHLKSNESLSNNSCYGDYTRGLRGPSPAPSSRGSMSVTNKINNLLSKTFRYPQSGGGGSNKNLNSTTTPMKLNTTSNIPKLAKSTDNLPQLNPGSTYAHVPSSGYGYGQAIPNNSFNRNSRSRSSLHKNFFRSKRVEPEGTENTGAPSVNSGGMMPSSSSSPLIITPMSFYSKSNGRTAPQEFYRGPNGSTLLSQDPSYDPYEMAAKQLDELLKAQPMPKNANANKRTARKLGLEKAFESVGVHTPEAFLSPKPDPLLDDNDDTDRKSNEDSFVFDISEKMNDSYWDEILRKSSASSGTGKSEQNQTSMSTSGLGSKSQQFDSDTNKSSRALSQISSPDSGFGRSGFHDPEFEALESMVANRDREQGHQSPFIASVHSSLRAPFGRKPLLSFSKDPEDSPSTYSRRDSTDSGIGSGARFCHDCGNAYPSPVAKFCPECGEKRVFKF